MEFKFDPRERRLRIRTLIPAGREPRVFAPDELFQFGIEEEYFLSDSETFEAPAETHTGRAFSSCRLPHHRPHRARILAGADRSRD